MPGYLHLVPSGQRPRTPSTFSTPITVRTPFLGQGRRAAPGPPRESATLSLRRADVGRFRSATGCRLVLGRPSFVNFRAGLHLIRCRLWHRRNSALRHSKSLCSAIWKRLFALDNWGGLYRNNAPSGRQTVDTRHSSGRVVAEYCEEWSSLDRLEFLLAAGGNRSPHFRGFSFQQQPLSGGELVRAGKLFLLFRSSLLISVN